MTDWKRLEKLNGGDRISFIAPRLDTKNEVWFFAQSSQLRVWSDGVLHKHCSRKTSPCPVVTGAA